MNLLRLPSLALSVLLQLLPLLRVATADAVLAASPVMAVLRLIAGATAMAGSYHAVSGATEITSAKAKLGAVGTKLTYRILSTGSPESFNAEPVPEGLVINTRTGVMDGFPVGAGETVVTVTAWNGPNFTQQQISGEVTFAVADIAPLSSTVEMGGLATFSVTGIETLPVTYRWLHDDLEISGATNAQFILPSVAAADAGSYRVRITFTPPKPAASAVVTSRAATLTVTGSVLPPGFTTIPSGATIHEGEALALSAVATGDGPLGFAWFRDGQPVAGDTASFLIPAATSADAGAYTVRVTGAGGSTNSPPAAVIVVAPLAFGIPRLDPHAEGNELVLPFNGIPGRTYVLESAAQLDTPPISWENLQETTGTEASAFNLQLPAPEIRVFRTRSK